MQDETRDLTTRKNEIRAAALARRQSLDDADAEARSAGIRRRLEALDLLSAARCVHAFWPIHEKHEVDLRPMLRRWADEGRTVVLPVVRRADHGGAALLEHRRFILEDQLVVSDWGIAEPLGGDEVDVRQIDAVLVPALTVDESGTRIGYGMGFYDRFLNEIDAVRICPIYDDDVVSTLPRQAHDQPVDVVVTERRTLTLHKT